MYPRCIAAIQVLLQESHFIFLDLKFMVKLLPHVMSDLPFHLRIFELIQLLPHLSFLSASNNSWTIIGVPLLLRAKPPLSILNWSYTSWSSVTTNLGWECDWLCSFCVVTDKCVNKDEGHCVGNFLEVTYKGQCKMDFAWSEFCCIGYFLQWIMTSVTRYK